MRGSRKRGRKTARSRSRNSPSAETESRRPHALRGLIKALPQLGVGFACGWMQPCAQQLRERAQHVGVLGYLRSRQDDFAMPFPPIDLIAATQIAEEQDVDIKAAIAETRSIAQASVRFFQLLKEVQQLCQCP